MPYVEKRRRVYYAALDVPQDVRHAIGKRRYFQSVKTESKAVAERRAGRLVAGWKLEIDRARKKLNGDPSDPLEDEAMFWRDALRKAKGDEDRDILREQVADIADDMWKAAASRQGMHDERDLPPEGLPELEAAKRFYALATGKVIRTADYIEEWTANDLQHVEAKTGDLKRLAVSRFCKAFPTVDAVNKKAVRQWAVDMMRGADGLAFASVQRTISDCRGYWHFLQRSEVVPEDFLPFDRLDLKGGNGGKAARRPSPKGARQPFASKDVPRLLQAATDKGDQHLADLIGLGMWTGCRLEELCALKVDKVTLGTDPKGDVIEIEDAKSPAGWRTVPVHTKLRTTLERLLEDTKDGYVISGLTLNKYGDRSNAIGKRFGRLKAKLGYGPQHVFHSIRKTVVTILENAGVAEGVVADIVGHEKPTMTYGLYSGGSTLATMRKAIRKLAYPRN